MISPPVPILQPSANKQLVCPQTPDDKYVQPMNCYAKDGEAEGVTKPTDPDAGVCAACIGDAVLIDRIKSTGAVGTCAFCGATADCLPLGEIAALVDQFHRLYHVAGAWMCNDDDWLQEGDYPEEIVMDLLACEPILADAVVAHLSARESHLVHHDGAEPMWDTSARYASVEVYPYSMHSTWQAFRTRMLQVRRYFDPDASASLYHLLGGIEDLEPFASRPIVRLFTAGRTADTVFRARRAMSPKEARDITDGVPISLGAPSPTSARAGRMNPAGIPVFYGGFSPDVCVAEVRPVIGGYVVVGSFEPTRNLRLLDLTCFSKARPVISPFDPSYHDVRTRWDFLGDFGNIISQPVLPDDEAIEYVPTQAVSEFVAHELGLDGLIYGSAQYSSQGETAANVVLLADHGADTNAKGSDQFGIRFMHGSVRVMQVTSMIIKTETAYPVEREDA